MAKVVTGGGGGGGRGDGRGADGEIIEGADGEAAAAAEIAAGDGEAGPKDLSASQEQSSTSPPLSPREQKASDSAAELAKTRAAAAAAALAATASMAGATAAAAAAAGDGGEVPVPPPMSAAATAQALEAAQRAAAAARDPRKDPEYAKFFSMLEAGVPRETVELAMLMEGKYPAVLNTPLPGPAVQKVTSTAASEAAQVALAWAERDHHHPPGSSGGRPFRRERRASSSRSPRERRTTPGSRSPRDRQRRTPRSKPPTAEAAAEAAREAVDSLVPARENPLYARFFEMLGSGTARADVAAAMERDGVDAAVLDAPDALFPLPFSAVAAADEPEEKKDTATSYAVEGAEAAAAKAAKASRDFETASFFKRFLCCCTSCSIMKQACTWLYAFLVSSFLPRTSPLRLSPPSLEAAATAQPSQSPAS